MSSMVVSRGDPRRPALESLVVQQHRAPLEYYYCYHFYYYVLQTSSARREWFGLRKCRYLLTTIRRSFMGTEDLLYKVRSCACTIFKILYAYGPWPAGAALKFCDTSKSNFDELTAFS